MISDKSRQLLEHFRLQSAYVGQSMGDYLRREVGQSLEFHDFRPYQRGDELRYVDWKAYRRTGKLYTRLYQAERALNVHILLDNSASMQVGDKIGYAKQLAQLLLYVARGNPSYIHSLTGEQRRGGQPQQLVEMWRFVTDMKVVGACSSYNAISTWVRNLPAISATGLVFIISDFFSDEALEPMLRSLKSRALDVVLLQTLAEADINPEAQHWQVVDSESEGKLEVSPAQVRAYRQQVLHFVEALKRSSQKIGFPHHLLRVPNTFYELQIVENLLKTGLLHA